MLAVKSIIYDSLRTEFHLNFINAARRNVVMFCLCASLFDTQTLISQTVERRPVKSVYEVWS